MVLCSLVAWKLSKSGWNAISAKCISAEWNFGPLRIRTVTNRIIMSVLDGKKVAKVAKKTCKLGETKCFNPNSTRLEGGRINVTTLTLNVKWLFPNTKKVTNVQSEKQIFRQKNEQTWKKRKTAIWHKSNLLISEKTFKVIIVIVKMFKNQSIILDLKKIWCEYLYSWVIRQKKNIHDWLSIYLFNYFLVYSSYNSAVM